MARIYLASSWRNEQQPALVRRLREWGHEVYDFRDPPHGQGGFAWSAVDPGWQAWSAEAFREILTTHSAAAFGYLADYRAMEWADTVVLLLPCGRSAHLELGWAAGRGKRTVVVLADGCEPELMYLMADHLVIGADELRVALGPVHEGAFTRHVIARRREFARGGASHAGDRVMLGDGSPEAFVPLADRRTLPVVG